jgi:type IV pilus assembly protein PilM
MISWKLKSRNQRPIGLDIGHNSIKMIQLAISGGHISVVAADKARIDASINGDAEERRKFVVSAVSRMLAEGDFEGRNVISCLPNDGLKITSLRLAVTGENEIEQILRREVVQRFGLDPDKDAINYLLAGNVRDGNEIKKELILFAADNETVKRHIDMLERAGLVPAGIDVIPCALFRSFERLLKRQEDMEQPVVFVDLGSRFTTVVFGRGGQISFIKQIPIGGEKFNQEIAAKLGVSINEAELLRETLRTEKMPIIEPGAPRWAASQELTGQESSLDASTRQVMIDAVGIAAEELTREISLCFRYYTVTFRGKRVERAIFAGGQAYENILLNVLKRQLSVEIEVAQPLKGVDMKNVDFDSDRRGLLCEWAVAVGLSLKGWNPTTVEADEAHKDERN